MILGEILVDVSVKGCVRGAVRFRGYMFRSSLVTGSVRGRERGEMGGWVRYYVYGNMLKNESRWCRISYNYSANISKYATRILLPVTASESK